MVSKTTTGHFICPNCNAFYQVAKIEAGPETVKREIICRACGGPLPGRDGIFVCKYFLLRKAIVSQKWRRNRPRTMAPEVS
jgi:uncharacterized protein YbaR (Trm112 family)